MSSDPATTGESVSPQDMANLAEMTRLLDEAYDHYFANGDGHCKSSEGHIGLSFNNYFDRQEDGQGLRVQGVTVYSYVLGPSRSHHFDTTADALASVRKWHEDEMTHDYEADEEAWANYTPPPSPLGRSSDA